MIYKNSQKKKISLNGQNNDDDQDNTIQVTDREKVKLMMDIYRKVFYK